MNIPNKIIIVAKPVEEWDSKKHKWVKTDKCQGYIVDPDSKKSLETAHNWAGSSNKAGKEYIYENGNFELTIYDSADGSSQGGKLSFWNCMIKAPDGHEFIIGISADKVFEMLSCNTFVNAKCQSKHVYLGRSVNVQTAFTDNMQSYKTLKAEDEMKTAVKTTKTVKYNKGDIIKLANGEDWVYCGEILETWRLDCCYSDAKTPEARYDDRRWRYYDGEDRCLVLQKSVKKQLFKRYENGEIKTDNPYWNTKILATKSSGMVIGHTDDPTISVPNKTTFEVSEEDAPDLKKLIKKLNTSRYIINEQDAISFEDLVSTVVDAKVALKTAGYYNELKYLEPLSEEEYNQKREKFLKSRRY